MNNINDFGFELDVDNLKQSYFEMIEHSLIQCIDEEEGIESSYILDSITNKYIKINKLFENNYITDDLNNLIKINISKDARIHYYIWWQIIYDKKFYQAICNGLSLYERNHILNMAKNARQKIKQYCQLLQKNPSNSIFKPLKKYKIYNKFYPTYKIEIDNINRFVFSYNQIYKKIEILDCMFHYDDSPEIFIIEHLARAYNQHNNDISFKILDKKMKQKNISILNCFKLITNK
jgi:tRNA nucleotidyltransferase/poly(A) polymerase